MIHLDDVIFYSLAAFVCFTIAAIFQSYNEVSEQEVEIKKRFYPPDPHMFNLNPGQIAITGHWNETAQEVIQLAKEMQKPRTIAVINDQTKTRTAKRIRKGTNSRTKKKNSPARTRNKSVRKTSGVQSK